MSGHTNKIYAGCFSIDSDRAVTASYDRSMRIWDMSNGRQVSSHGCASSCNYLSMSPNGNMMASAHLDSHIRFWSYRTGELMQDLDSVHTQSASCAEFSRDGNLVVTNSRDNTLKVIDVRTFKVLHILRGNTKCMAIFISHH